MKPKLIETKDGSHTLFLPEINEQYHSVNGALTESKHIYINAGFLAQKFSELTVFEVGFGTGLNCLLTVLEAEKRTINTTYVSIEKYPLEPETIDQLNYPQILEAEASVFFKRIHETPWEEVVEITEYFKLLKLKLDLTSKEIPKDLSADIIYFDAFGPDKQPEMWEMPILKKVTDLLKPKGIFVTYSVKGSIKRCLQSFGFSIEKLPGPPGKKEILRGIKI